MGRATGRQAAAPRRAQAHPAPPACHVHGVVPTGARVPDREVTRVAHRRVTALVRPHQAAAGVRRDMVAHADLLDTTAATTPVLPMRFGTALASPEAVERDLLAPYHDTFVAGLAALTGRAQFTVRARYQQDSIVREVLEQEPAAVRLHRQVRSGSGTDQAGRVALGEMIAKSILARRQADSAALDAALRPYAVLTSVQVSQSLEGYRIADAAFLVELDRQQEFEQAVEQLAHDWRHRAAVRLLGPMAAYHFVDHLLQLPEGR